ncbi:hypothetical protein GCM10023084_64520 [Streptomyces lacrimifluminis]|uniref:Uncharacterized protein n=1 Tax=Streptomyces lacrimifluminis TaxID=1500077 RepID=A0A917LE73_9ACTN|nr:hypothetical protein GCM10012282_64830 [Streptomyces lacrimifluminis]
MGGAGGPGAGLADGAGEHDELEVSGGLRLAGLGPGAAPDIRSGVRAGGVGSGQGGCGLSIERRKD